MAELTKIILNKLTTRILIVLIAITLVSTFGVIYAIDLGEEDHKNGSFILTFGNFNATDSTTPERPYITDFTARNSIHYDKFILLNDPHSRLTPVVFTDRGNIYGGEATLVDGYTDGKNFEFTWLVNHPSAPTRSPFPLSSTSEILVSGKCDVTETLLPGSNSTLTFTTIKGDLVITPGTVPSPNNNAWSNYSSVCQTVP